MMLRTEPTESDLHAAIESIQAQIWRLFLASDHHSGGAFRRCLDLLNDEQEGMYMQLDDIWRAEARCC